MENIKKINRNLESRRKYLLLTLNIALIIFVLLEISILNTISPNRAEVPPPAKNCVMENRLIINHVEFFRL